MSQMSQILLSGGGSDWTLALRYGGPQGLGGSGPGQAGGDYRAGLRGQSRQRSVAVRPFPQIDLRHGREAYLFGAVDQQGDVDPVVQPLACATASALNALWW